MPTRVKKEELKKIYVVVDCVGIQYSSSAFEAALRYAREVIDSGCTDASIFEVTRAWVVEIPEKPPPEAVEMELGSI